jgi:hypothetical protein
MAATGLVVVSLGHERHIGEPRLGVYVRLVHTSQKVAAGPVANLPKSHAVQLLLPRPTEYVPLHTTHTRHEEKAHSNRKGSESS